VPISLAFSHFMAVFPQNFLEEKGFLAKNCQLVLLTSAKTFFRFASSRGTSFDHAVGDKRGFFKTGKTFYRALHFPFHRKSLSGNKK
jgi:hypothetical protein